MTWEVDRRTNSKAAGWKAGAPMVPTVPVSMDRPAPTLTGKAGTQWVFRNGAQARATVRTLDEPAPTILASADNGDSRFVSDDGTYRMGIREALLLQSFPPDYPFQGTKGKKFEQIGNAIPPVLAMAVLGQVVPPNARPTSAPRTSASAAWCCEECGEPWAPLPDRPGQCRRCGNRTRLPCPTKTSPNAAQEYL